MSLRKLVGAAFLILFVCALVVTDASVANAQCVSLTTPGAAYTQDFNSLSNVAGSTTNNLTIPGWFMTESGGGARDNEQYAVDGGGSNTGDTYSYGADGSTDRALGGLLSGTLNPTFGACFTNNTGTPITTITVQYTGKQFRVGTANRTDRIDFQYSLDATSLTTGTYTNEDLLDYAGPQSATTGKVANITSVGPTTISGLAIPNGASFWIRWTDYNASGADDGLAVDDFSLTPAANGGPVASNPMAEATATAVNAGETTTFSGTITPGENPTSANYTVSCDLTSVGGGSSYALQVSGTFISGTYTVPSNVPPNTYSLPCTVTDDHSRTGNFFISLGINAQNLTIMHIQGSGSRSPYEGQRATTSGVIYDVSYNGYWIQDPNGDGDENTSDGLFVFTSSAPTGISKGDLVNVTGSVAEFATSGDPSAAPMTELTGRPTASVISSGNPIPEPVNIAAGMIDPNGGIDQLERFEGMRVHIDRLNVVAPTQGTLSEANATSTSNGVFFGVMPEFARPFRQAGIELPAQAPAGAPCCIPFWNGGPQRIRVDTDVISAAFGKGLNLTTGAVVSNLTGPLDFGQHAYTIVTETLPAIEVDNISAVPAPAPENTEFTVGSFNMERFFDTVNDDGVSDVALTTTAFSNRLNKASLAIRHVMRSPDIIGVEEMENLSTLQTLANKLNSDAVAEGGAGPQYQGYLVEGNDIGGIDVGLLVKASRITVNSVTQYGKDTTYIDPNSGQPALLNDRPPLVLDASVTNEGETTRFIFIVNHLRSLNGVDDPADGRVRAKRAAQAEYLANLIQGFQASDPNAKIVSVGDYNAFEVSDGYVDVIGTILGNPTPAEQVTLASPDLVDPNLVELASTLPADQQYSYTFSGVAQTLDHILISQGMNSIFTRFAYARNDADFPETYRNDPDRPERLSDHDMPVAYFNLPLDHTPPVLTLPADFTVEATSPAGAVVTYAVSALDSNDGETAVVCHPASGSTFPLGVNTVSCKSSDARNNTAAGEFHVNVVDTTPPVVTVTGVQDGATYTFGSVPVAGCSTTDTVSSIAVQASLSVTGGTPNGVGTYTATCSGGQDAPGNIAPPVSATYTVEYAWSGFLPPVSNGAIHQAGSTIPLKWTLNAGNLSSITSVMAAANPDCSGVAEGAPFPAVTPGNSTLTLIGGLFQINWQTKGVSAGCYNILLGLDDGSTRTTMVRFKSNGK